MASTSAGEFANKEQLFEVENVKENEEIQKKFICKICGAKRVHKHSILNHLHKIHHRSVCKQFFPKHEKNIIAKRKINFASACSSLLFSLNFFPVEVAMN